MLNVHRTTQRAECVESITLWNRTTQSFKVTGQRKNRCVQKLIVLLITELQKTAKSTSWSFKFCVENMFCYDIEIIWWHGCCRVQCGCSEANCSLCRLYSSDFMNQNLKNWTANNNFWFYFECKHLSDVVFKDLRRPQQVQSGAEVCGTLWKWTSSFLQEFKVTLSQRKNWRRDKKSQ